MSQDVGTEQEKSRANSTGRRLLRRKRTAPQEVPPAPQTGIVGGEFLDESGQVLKRFAGRGMPARPRLWLAQRGYYAPQPVGASTTTRQAEILNPAIIGEPTGAQGIPQGRDVLSRAIVAHDPITAYPHVVSSTNVAVIGDVGAGKSTCTKCNYALRALALADRQVVVYDRKDENGEGEYSELTRFYGNDPLKFSVEPGADTARLNLLDPAVGLVRGDSGQLRLLRTVCELARGSELNEVEREALRAAYALTRQEVEHRVPTLADLGERLGVISAAQYGDHSPAAQERLHQAGLVMRYLINDFLAEYGGVFDGDTSSAFQLNSRLTSFDISQLPSDGPIIPAVMAVANMWLTGRIRAQRRNGNRMKTHVIAEEGWQFSSGPVGEMLRADTKLHRGLGMCLVFVFHKIADIPTDSPALALIQEAQTVHIFRQTRPADAARCGEMFDLAPDARRTIMDLPTGTSLLKIGAAREVQVEGVLTPEEARLTNTDSALVS